MICSSSMQKCRVQVELLIYIVTFLHSICRLEHKGDKNVLGEFIEFKGRHEDIQLLKKLKRSKVGRFIIQKSTLFGGFGKFHEPYNEIHCSGESL